MIDTNSPIFVCLLFGGTCGTLAVLLAILYFFGKRMSGNLQAVSQHIEETFGLTNNNPKGLYPDLQGAVDGVEVAIDVQFHDYLRGNRVGTELYGKSKRVWTRVRVQLTETPLLQIRSRPQKVTEKIDYPRRETGDPAFEEKYEVFMPADALLEEILTPALKEALMAADPPVHILNNVVLWTQLKTVKDPQLLEQVVRSCVRVAAVLNKEK